ncbi:hypothetical protein DW094_05995 [Ruminococcaceae bacterium AM07-15]|nr:hypothetical protein DW094_05995 [Ruminococcaceae bacterium AM07-15]
MQAFFVILQKNFSADNHTTIRGFFPAFFCRLLIFQRLSPIILNVCNKSPVRICYNLICASPFGEIDEVRMFSMGKGARSRKERVQQQEQMAAQQQEQKGKRRLRKALCGLAAILVLVLLVFGLLYATGTLQRHMTAMTVGDSKISGQEYSYYYNMLRSNFLSSNESYLSSMGLTSSTLDDANYTEDMTFGEYFRQQTDSTIRVAYELYNEATENGYEMSQEGQENYDANIQAVKDAAKKSDTSETKYLQTVTGVSITMEEYEEILWKDALGKDYYENTQAKEYTAEDLEGYYAENADQFDLADYRVFQVFFDAEDEASKTAAKEKADAFAAAVTDEQSFIDMAKEQAAEDQVEQYSKPEGTLTEGATLSTSGTVIDWVKDASRKEGDVEVLEISSNYSVVYFIDRYRDDSESVDVRHILLSVAEDSDEAAKNEVKAQAEALLEEWKAGEATEDSFAELAREHSSDSNASQGGLYTGINESTNFVDTFKNWCLDESRQVGDTGIVETEYGYHIMYFVGSRPTWESSAEEALTNDDYYAYLDEMDEKYPMEQNDKVIDMVI